MIYAIAEFQAGIHISAWQWVANLTFTANYSEAEGPTGHLWTLGVEEQFYVIWPLAFLLLTRTASPSQWNNRMIGALTVVLVACPIIRGGCYLIPKDEVPWLLNPFSFLRHADEIGWGCMAAVCFWTKPRLWDLLDRHKYLISIAGISMILAPWFTGPINGFNLINVPLGPSMQSIGYAALMLCSISNDQCPLFRWLNFRLLALLGTLSYSLYIWHTLFVPQHSGWPTLTFGRLDELPWWPLLALTMAACSFWGLEKPFLSLRKKFTTHQ